MLVVLHSQPGVYSPADCSAVLFYEIGVINQSYGVFWGTALSNRTMKRLALPRWRAIRDGTAENADRPKYSMQVDLAERHARHNAGQGDREHKHTQTEARKYALKQREPSRRAGSPPERGCRESPARW